jgi:hypothetical protein
MVRASSVNAAATPMRPCINPELVVSAPNVLHQRVTRRFTRAVSSRFRPRIERSRDLSRAWSASIRSFAYCALWNAARPAVPRRPGRRAPTASTSARRGRRSREEPEARQISLPRRPGRSRCFRRNPALAAASCRRTRVIHGCQRQEPEVDVSISCCAALTAFQQSSPTGSPTCIRGLRGTAGQRFAHSAGRQSRM